MAAPAAEGYQAMSSGAPGGIRPLLAKRSRVLPRSPRAPEPVAVPLDAYRRRARELHERLARSGEGERAGRLAELRQRLGELLDDLRSVGVPEQELRPLDELLAQLERLDADAAAGTEALARLWERALAALDAFAGATGAAPVPGPRRDRRAEFWKRPPS
jgi:hypothetical protein